MDTRNPNVVCILSKLALRCQCCPQFVPTLNRWEQDWLCVLSPIATPTLLLIALTQCKIGPGFTITILPFDEPAAIKFDELRQAGVRIGTRDLRIASIALSHECTEDLKTRVRSAQLKAAVVVNRELIQLYWDIGRLIVERQDKEDWGKSVVERLAADIQRAFPGIQGFSPVNVWRMRAFFLAYLARWHFCHSP